MNKIFSLIRVIKKKFTITKIINKFDQDINHHFLPNGYQLEKNVISDLIAMPKPIFFDDFGMYEHRDIDQSLATVAMEAISYFNNTIEGYIGNDVRIDDIKLMWFDPKQAKKISVSGYWHNDQCGNRLKLYICLKGDGKTPTVYLPNSHTKKYKFSFWDVLRFVGFKNSKAFVKEKKLRLSSGDCVIFDTNGMHRGMYEEGSAERVTILVEFIDKNKSNEISGIAPTGPGNNRTGFINFDKDAYNIFSQSALFDTELLKPVDDLFQYSLRYKK